MPPHPMPGNIPYLELNAPKTSIRPLLRESISIEEIQMQSPTIDRSLSYNRRIIYEPKVMQQPKSPKTISVLPAIVFVEIPVYKKPKPKRTVVATQEQASVQILDESAEPSGNQGKTLDSIENTASKLKNPKKTSQNRSEDIPMFSLEVQIPVRDLVREEYSSRKPLDRHHAKETLPENSDAPSDAARVEIISSSDFVVPAVPEKRKLDAIVSSPPQNTRSVELLPPIHLEMPGLLIDTPQAHNPEEQAPASGPSQVEESSPDVQRLLEDEDPFHEWGGNDGAGGGEEFDGDVQMTEAELDQIMGISNPTPVVSPSQDASQASERLAASTPRTTSAVTDVSPSLGTSSGPNLKLRPVSAYISPSGELVIENYPTHANWDTRMFRLIPAERFLFLKWDKYPTVEQVERQLNQTITFVDEQNRYRRFVFLGSTESRLRDRSVIYFEPNKQWNIEKVLFHTFGDLKDVWINQGIGKFIARLSLNFSPTVPTIDVATSGGYRVIEDKIAPDGKAYTDGCGIITEEAAMKVAELLGKDYVPSIFQIRFMGAKGLIVKHRKEDIQRWFPEQYHKDVLVYLRPSMIKYDASQFSTLDIRDHSRPRNRNARLDKFLIAILSSLGIADEVFVNLLKAEMVRLEGCLKTEEGTEDWLRKKGGDERAIDKELRSRPDDAKGRKSRAAHQKGLDDENEHNYGATQALDMLLAGHDLSEPRLSGLLSQLLRQEYSRLKEKLNIPIPQSVRVFGICDESGELEEDQVYLHSGEEGYIEGRVMVTRAPASHPGDIRILQAVIPPPSISFRSCVVFSTKGDQPVADMMAGGDLDGDQFLACWNPDLIPAEVCEPNPRPAGTKDKPKIPFDETWTEYLQRMCAKWISNCDTGKWANEWLKAVEESELGAKDPCALRRSELYELSLDALKAGGVPIADDVASGIQGPKRTTSFAGKILRELVYTSTETEEELNWSKEKFGTISEARRKEFVTDPELVYRNDTQQWKDEYELCEQVRKGLQTSYMDIIKRHVNSKLSGKAEEDAAWNIVFHEFALTLEARKRELFGEDSLEQNERMMIRASAFYAATYDLIREETAKPFPELAWWGARFINFMKAQRVGERIGVYGAPIAVAPRARKRIANIANGTIATSARQKNLEQGRKSAEARRMSEYEAWQATRGMFTEGKKRKTTMVEAESIGNSERPHKKQKTVTVQ